MLGGGEPCGNERHHSWGMTVRWGCLSWLEVEAVRRSDWLDDGMNYWRDDSNFNRTFEPTADDLRRMEAEQIQAGISSAQRMDRALQDRMREEDRQRSNRARDYTASVVGATKEGMARGERNAAIAAATPFAGFGIAWGVSAGVGAATPYVVGGANAAIGLANSLTIKAYVTYQTVVLPAITTGAYKAYQFLKYHSVMNSHRLPSIGEGAMEVYEGIPGGSYRTSAMLSAADMAAEDGFIERITGLPIDDLIPFTP